MTSKLEVVGRVGQRNTGTTVRFWPDPKFFDTDRSRCRELKRVLKAKAVLCPGLRGAASRTRPRGEKEEWFYTGHLGEYLIEQLGKAERLPAEPITGKHESEQDVRRMGAGLGAAMRAQLLAESYVNLIPTTAGGTHVNGLRAGVTDAVREFCEFRNLLPRGVKLTPEDVWDRACFVLSHQAARPAVRRPDQGEARLARGGGAGARRTRAMPSALWLNQHPDAGERIAQFAIENAQERLRAAQRVRASAPSTAPRCRASWPTAPARIRRAPSCSWSRAIRPAVRPSRRATAISRPSCRCAARS